MVPCNIPCGLGGWTIVTLYNYVCTSICSEGFHCLCASCLSSVLDLILSCNIHFTLCGVQQKEENQKLVIWAPKCIFKRTALELQEASLVVYITLINWDINIGANLWVFTLERFAFMPAPDPGAGQNPYAYSHPCSVISQTSESASEGWVQESAFSQALQMNWMHAGT